MNKNSGIVSIKIDGKLTSVTAEGIEYEGFANKKEMQLDQDGPAGYSETPQIPTLKFKTRDSDEFDLVAFCDIKDAFITADLNNGKTVCIEHACFADVGNVKSSNGEVSCTFHGKRGYEVA